MRSRLRTGWILAILGALALMGACSLNTQPIPPGVTDGTGEGSDASGIPTNAATGGDGGADGKGGTDADASFPNDDGGDDAGDASLTDDASDSGDQ
jgi:hypothetical protein